MRLSMFLVGAGTRVIVTGVARVTDSDTASHVIGHVFVMFPVIDPDLDDTLAAIFRSPLHLAIHEARRLPRITRQYMGAH